MMRYFIVDAFTDRAFGGNPAGVVLLYGGFPDEQLMQQIAAELRYSETAFVHRDNSNEYTVRYFTPLAEVDLCGHATIAAFGTLRQEGILQDDTVCKIHTLAGDLKVKIGDTVMMQMAPPVVMDKHLDEVRLHAIMTGNAPTEWPPLPVEIISTGLPDIIMPVKDIPTLNTLQPDMTSLAALSHELQVVGVHAFTLSRDNHTAHVRNFAPLCGIPEEPATGTANAALAHYLYHHGIITQPSMCSFLQGEAMDRPSVVVAQYDHDAIWIGGNSKIIATGNLLI